MYDSASSGGTGDAGGSGVRKAVVIPIEAEQNYNGPDMAAMTTTSQPVLAVHQSGEGKRRKRRTTHTRKDKSNQALQGLLRLKLAQHDVFNKHNNIRSKNGSYLPFTDMAALLEFAVQNKLSAIKEIPQGIEDFAYWLVKSGVTPDDIPNSLLANSMIRIGEESKLFTPQNVEKRRRVQNAYITELPVQPLRPYEQSRVRWNASSSSLSERRQRQAYPWHEIYPPSKNVHERAENLDSVIKYIGKIPTYYFDDEEQEEALHTSPEYVSNENVYAMQDPRIERDLPTPDSTTKPRRGVKLRKETPTSTTDHHDYQSTPIQNRKRGSKAMSGYDTSQTTTEEGGQLQWSDADDDLPISPPTKRGRSPYNLRCSKKP